MASKNCVKAIPLTNIDSATFTGNYQAINTGGFPNAPFLIIIQNNSNKDVTVSYDGVTDNEYVKTGVTLELIVGSSNQPSSYASVFPVGTTVYVKGVSGVGLVYLSGYYIPLS